MFQLSLYLLEALLLPQCQSIGQRRVTLCWLSPKQNYCKMTCLCCTFQLKGLASRLWSVPRTHCCGSAESCGHFLSCHLADRLKVARYDHFRKLSYHEKQRFVCNERRTTSLVGAIQHIRISTIPAVRSPANWEGKEQRQHFLRDINVYSLFLLTCFATIQTVSSCYYCGTLSSFERGKHCGFRSPCHIWFAYNRICFQAQKQKLNQMLTGLFTALSFMPGMTSMTLTWKNLKYCLKTLSRLQVCFNILQCLKRALLFDLFWSVLHMENFS